MSFLFDLRYAARMLRRAPGFTLVVVIVLALGIGANTAIFSIVNAVLLQPPPVSHPEQLVQMFETEAAPGSYPLSGPDFPDWKAQSRLFADMTLYRYALPFNLNDGGEPTRVTVVPAAANFFGVLGVPAALGRTFAPGEDGAGKDHVAVLSDGLWRASFGADRGILGRAIRLNGEAYTVVGVMPAAFRLQPTVDLWVPMDMSLGALGQRGNHSYAAIGRLRPGVTLAAAQAEISAIAAGLARRYPDSNSDTGARLFSLRDRLVPAGQRASILTLLGVVGLLLLLACANVANLMLARALGRQREMSIRLALGAARTRILRQLLTESVLLALLGGALGMLPAWLGVRALTALPSFPLPRFNPIGVDYSVLAFTTLLAVLCGVVFGLAPALQLTSPRLHGELSGAGTLAGPSRRRRWLSDGLVAGEIAISLLLVLAAGLFVRSFLRLRQQNVGVNPDRLVTAKIILPDNAYGKDAQASAFTREFLGRLQAMPGVDRAALSSELPLEGGSNGYVRLKDDPQRRYPMLVEWTRATSDYFAAMQIPVLAGRTYSGADIAAWAKNSHLLSDENAPGALTNALTLPVVVNQTMVREFFPGREPLGAQFSWGSESGPWLTVIGVVRDLDIFGLTQPPMAQAFFPAEVTGMNPQMVVLRSPLPPATLAAETREQLRQLDPNLALYSVRTMDEVIDASTANQAMQIRLMALFAALALLLAAAGVYGVLSYLVSQRTREIGIRMALGASPAQIQRLIVLRGLRLAGLGIAAGLGAAIFASRLIASQLYGVKTWDPATLAAGTLVLLTASVLACALPARRAAAVDPNQALRAQ